MAARYLVVASETPDQREARRRDTGAASDETYAQTLRDLAPGCHVDRISCVDGPAPSPDQLASYDAAFFAGSPISMNKETSATRAAVALMRQVFQVGLPAFGSCAGLQIAAVAAGGSTRPRDPTTEAGFARGIVATPAGQDHPLLRGRPPSWDAPAMHSDEVATLPAGAVVLARSSSTGVQAAEIRHAGGVFWGVQYHPELTLAEIASALRRQEAELVEQGLASDRRAVRDHADRIDALDRAPHRRDLAWQLGLDAEVTDPHRRTVEIRNFIEYAATLKHCGASGTGDERPPAADPPREPT